MRIDEAEGSREPAAGRSSAARWRAVGASVRGKGHERNGTACQDAHSWWVTPEGYLLAAIADGAGSAPHADVGAALAAETAVQRLPLHPLPQTDLQWRLALERSLREAQDAVRAEAARRRVSPADLASTLIVLVATPDLVAAAQVGDGAVILGDAAGTPTALTVPQSGEYANETVFIVSPGGLEGAQLRVWHGRAAYLCAFSDGLQMLAMKMPDGTPHPPFFAPLFRFAGSFTDPEAARRQLAGFLTSPRISQRSDDDLTLLLAALTE